MSIATILNKRQMAVTLPQGMPEAGHQDKKFISLKWDPAVK